MENPDQQKTQPGRRRPLFSIRAKIMGAFIAVFIVYAAAILYMFSARLPEYYDRLARLRVTSALKGISSDFQLLRADTEKRVESIAGDRSVAEDVWLITKTSAGRGHFIDRVGTIRGTTGLDILQVVSNKKILIADGAHPAVFDVSVEDDPYVEEVLKTGNPRVILKKMVTQDSSEKVTIVVYQPVWYHSSPVAVLIGGRHIGEEYMQKLHNLATARVVLFVDYKPVVSSVGTDPAATLPVGDEFLKELEREPETIRQAGRGDNDYLIGGVPLRDEQTGALFGFFVMGVSRTEVKTIMQQTSMYIFLIAAVGTLISIILALAVSIGITRPISLLVQYARKVGRGEFSGAAPVKSRDEVGLLADTMNRMTRDLDDYSKRLAYSERMAAWNEIARRMAHEIKNPLSPIQLSMENLKASYSDDRERFDKFFPQCADTVLEEVEKLKKLANEFSEFARLPKPEFSEVEVTEMLQNLVAFHSSSSPENITIELVVEASPVMVRADRDQLNRVFTNLIKNAVQAMSGGGRLTVTVQRREGEVFLLFEDEGPGIPAADIERIFVPYYTTKSGGTGLGLSIVNRILRDHDASIDVTSEQGRGTRFTLVFREVKAK